MVRRAGPRWGAGGTSGGGGRAGGAGGGAVAGDGVVDQIDDVAAGHAHATPGVGVDRVADDVVRPPVGVEEVEAVASIAIDQAVGDDGARIAAVDSDTAVARSRAVADEAQAL